jgi:predicted enzyme related to lactoylglutathione lyase
MAIKGVGWVAYCTDPGGNIFGVYREDSGAT